MITMLNKKQKKKKSNKETNNNSEPPSNQLTVAVQNKTGTAINYIMKKAPGLLPAMVHTAKLITPKLPSKKHKKNPSISNNGNIDYSNQLLSSSSSSPIMNSNSLIPSTKSTKSGSSKSLNEGKTGTVIDHQRRPSEPTPFRNTFLPGSSPSSPYNRPGGVPTINVHSVDSVVIDHSINSMPKLKESYLKRIDFDLKTSSTSRGWKVYRVNLRGSKLYFYKPPSEAVLKTFFPNNNDIQDIPSTLSPIIANDRGMNLNPSNFESNAAKLIFEGGTNSTDGEMKYISPLIKKYYYGEMGHEVDRTVMMRFKKHVCLLIFEDNVVICKRKWVRYTANLRIMDAMGFGGGNHSSVNVSSSNGVVDFGGGQDIDARSISSTRGIPENDGSTNNKGKGYYTKWKLDACYPIHSVEVTDPNFQATYTPYIAPSSQSSSFNPTNRMNDVETSSLHSASSLISVSNVNTTSSATLYLNITDGRDKDSYRVFVVPNNEIRSLWEAKLFDAKKTNLRKMMIQQDGVAGTDQHGMSVVSHDQNSPINGFGTDKSEVSSPIRRTRVYWGTDKHPELILKEIKPKQNSEYDNVSASTSPVTPSPPPLVEPTSSQRLIRGGSVDSLIHELIFDTQKGSSDDDDNDEFLHAFLLTYSLFTDPNHIFRELRRCGSMQNSMEDNDNGRKKSNSKRLFTILFTWCKNYGRDLSRDEVYNGMLETVEEIFIKEDITEYEELKKLIRETRENLLNVTDEDNEDQLSSLKGPPAPLSLDLSNLLVTGLTPALFLKMVPKELAQQLYIYHFLELKKINPGQILKSFIPSKHRSDSYASPLNATPTAPHFVTKLIYHHILILTQQSAYTNRRPLLLIHWIKTGMACKALGDMTGWIAVALAICSPAIVRLKETWRHVDKQWIEVVVNDWVPLLVTCGGVDGEIDIENLKSLLLVIRDKKEKSKTKPVPYFGFITLALERLNSTIPAVIDRNDTTLSSRNNSITGPNVINFEKYWKMYDTVIESLTQWQQSGNFNEITRDSCPFSPSTPLQKYFHQFNSVPASSALDTWQLFDSSLNCEPRLHGQYLEHHARQRKSHSSSYVPLIFTEVVPTNRLFEKNALLSASGALGKRSSNSSLNIGDNNPTISSSGRPTISGPTPLVIDVIPVAPSRSKPNSPNHLSVQPLRGSRKRTLSFPPARIGPLTSTTWNTGLDLVTRNWLGGLVQHRGGHNVLLKCMKDIAGVGEMLMFVKDGELVFKSVRDATGSRPASIIESSSGSGSKRNSIHGLALTQPNSPRTSIHVNSDHDALMVVVKSGTLERLVDVLINGVASYSTSVVDDNGEPPLTIGRQGQLGIDSEEYLATFFSTYRSFCSPILLLDILRKRFINAKKVSKGNVELSPTSDGKSKTESVNNNHNMVVTIQSKVLKVFHYWIAEFFYDFLDDLTLRNRLMHFIDEAKIEMETWSKIIMEESLETSVEEIKNSLSSLKRLATTKSLEPVHDFQDEKTTYLVDKVTNDLCRLPHIENDDKEDEKIVIPSTDDNEVCDLLDSIDSTVLRLFEAITPRDWILTYEILETQSSDVLGWYPKKQSSSVSEDEIVITDIFTTLQRTERIGKSKEYIINSFPRSIQALCRMHNTIRGWIIREITSTFEYDKRVNRINKLLDMIVLSRKRMDKLDIYPKDEAAKQEFESKRVVPSFVESSIVSGLISPESRLFMRAWNDVAQSRNAGLESLDTLIQSDLSKTAKDPNPNTALVPCVGWLFERMLEICCNVPDMSFESDKLINYDKRRYVYNLIQIFVRLQHELTERSQEVNTLVDVRFLTSTNLHNGLSKLELRNIKELASRENSVRKFQRVLCKLVSEQQEKVKRDQKERDRLAKDIRDTQNKLQKKQNEQARLLKQPKPHHRPRNKSRVESFIKSVARPLSFAFTGTWPSNNSGSSANLKNLYLSGQTSPSTKVALVINLINSKASEASSEFGSKLDSVFRIVTEDGGQYLFQALDNDNMNDWIRVINEAAIEGAEKRKTILGKEPNIPKEDKEEEIPDEPKTRVSVYGKDLKTLMSDNKIPVLVEKCITEIEKRGLREVGIYRVAGASNAVNELRAAFNKNADAVNLSEGYGDINVVADALKRFFRDLPEPITTYELYDSFIEANGIEGHDEKLYAIKDVLQKLPKPNYELLKRLIEHLERVTDCEEINHMYASNLAIVFGPSLLKTRDFVKSMGNLGHHHGIIKCLILQYHWLFNVEEEETSEVEYQDDLLDPDMETSEPDGENEDRQTQENTLVTDDDVSFEHSITGSEHDNEVNHLVNEFDEETIEENSGGHLQEYIERSSSKQNIEPMNSEQYKIEDIDNNKDSTLADVTEELEGELEEPKSKDMMYEQHNILFEHSNIIYETNNRDSVLTNITEVSGNASTIEPIENAEPKEQDIKDNRTSQNLNGTEKLDTISTTKNLTERPESKYRFSVNLIDFDSDYNTSSQQSQQFNMSENLMNHRDHLMDRIDNFENEATLDKPLQPEKIVR